MLAAPLAQAASLAEQPFVALVAADEDDAVQVVEQFGPGGGVGTFRIDDDRLPAGGRDAGGVARLPAFAAVPRLRIGSVVTVDANGKGNGARRHGGLLSSVHEGR